MSDRRQMAQLREVAQMISEREMADLARAASKCDALRTEIAGLRRQARDMGAGVVRGAHPGQVLLAGRQAEKWRKWCEGRILELNGLLAAAEAEREAAMVQARAAFGREQALGEVLEQARATTRPRLA